MDFKPFVKIPRWSRECIITEKIDGTNASIYIAKEESCALSPVGQETPPWTDRIAIVPVGDPGVNGFWAHIWAGSRTRWINPEKDNYGFAKWVQSHATELGFLGPGHHFGEWWGQGIQRKYNQTEKRFSLFDIRWDTRDNKPTCCGVVPVLYRGILDEGAITRTMIELKLHGSHAAPGFDKPEGIVIWHGAARQYFKKTFEKDEAGKG